MKELDVLFSITGSRGIVNSLNNEAFLEALT